MGQKCRDTVNGEGPKGLLAQMPDDACQIQRGADPGITPAQAKNKLPTSFIDNGELNRLFQIRPSRVSLKIAVFDHVKERGVTWRQTQSKDLAIVLGQLGIGRQGPTAQWILVMLCQQSLR